MTRCWLLIVLVLCSASARAGDKAADEMKKLQGEWQVVQVEARGKKVSKDDARAKHMRFVFEGDTITIPLEQSKAELKSTFKLDPSKSPKSIDVIALDGPLKGQTAAGIYKLEKDRLTICIPNFPPADPSKRPTKFQAGTAPTMA